MGGAGHLPERRRNIQGRTSFTVTEPIPVLQTDKTAYQPTDKIVVTFSNVFGDPTDYITLQPAGAPAAAYAPYYQHMGGAKSGTLTFAPLTPGQWEARVIYREEDGNIQGRQGFKVVSAATCPASLSPGSGAAAASGSSGSLSVNAGAGCNWTAQPGASWIHITSGASGAANGTVAYTVDANASLARTGGITVAGGTPTVDSQIYPITQAAATGGTPVRSCVKIGRKRPRQAKPPAPPLTANNLHWWRRRFRLRILIFSQLLTINNFSFETLPSNPQ